MAEAAGDGVQVGARSQELGRGVVPELLQRTGDADPAGVPTVAVGHRVGVPRLAAHRVRREGERIVRHLDADGLCVGSAALEPVAEQLAGQKVQRQDAAFTVLGRLLDPVPLLDDVIRGDPDLLAGEVEPVLAQRADFTAPGSGRDRSPRITVAGNPISPAWRCLLGNSVALPARHLLMLRSVRTWIVCP